MFPEFAAGELGVARFDQKCYEDMAEMSAMRFRFVDLKSSYLPSYVGNTCYIQEQ
jgi:hypothetical protein